MLPKSANVVTRSHGVLCCADLGCTYSSERANQVQFVTRDLSIYYFFIYYYCYYISIINWFICFISLQFLNFLSFGNGGDHLALSPRFWLFAASTLLLLLLLFPSLKCFMGPFCCCFALFIALHDYCIFIPLHYSYFASFIIFHHFPLSLFALSSPQTKPRKAAHAIRRTLSFKFCSSNSF